MQLTAVPSTNIDVAGMALPVTATMFTVQPAADELLDDDELLDVGEQLSENVTDWYWQLEKGGPMSVIVAVTVSPVNGGRPGGVCSVKLGLNVPAGPLYGLLQEGLVYVNW